MAQDTSTLDNRSQRTETFHTKLGVSFVVTVYFLDGTYTIKGEDGRDIREENRPILHLAQLNQVRQEILSWIQQEMERYNADIAPNSDNSSGSSIDDTSTDTVNP